MRPGDRDASSARTRATATSAIGTTAIAARKNAISSRTANGETVVCSISTSATCFASVAARRQRLLGCRHQKMK